MQQRVVKEIRKIVDSLLNWPLLFHLVVALCAVWLAGCLQVNFVCTFVIAIVYLHTIDELQKERLKLQIKHRIELDKTHKLRVTDAETVTWLNVLLQESWPSWLERYLSKAMADCLHVNLNRYKLRSISKLVVDRLRLGSSSPVIHSVKVFRNPNGGEQTILEVDVSFVAADDMRLELAAVLKKASVGLGLTGKLYGNNLLIEGKLRLGLKFVGYYPYVGELSVAFVSAPTLGLSIRPLSSSSLDVTDFPGVASWVSKAVQAAIETCLVEPYPLVLDLIRIFGAEYDLDNDKDGIHMLQHGEMSLPRGVLACHKANLDLCVKQLSPDALPLWCHIFANVFQPPCSVHKLKRSFVAVVRLGLLFRSIQHRSLLPRSLCQMSFKWWTSSTVSFFMIDFLSCSTSTVASIANTFLFDIKDEWCVIEKSMNAYWGWVSEDWLLTTNMQYINGRELCLLKQETKHNRSRVSGFEGWQEVDLVPLRGGDRHDMWLKLHGVKTGHIHIAVTVLEPVVSAPQGESVPYGDEGSSTSAPQATFSEIENEAEKLESFLNNEKAADVEIIEYRSNHLCSKAGGKDSMADVASQSKLSFKRRVSFVPENSAASLTRGSSGRECPSLDQIFLSQSCQNQVQADEVENAMKTSHGIFSFVFHKTKTRQTKSEGGAKHQRRKVGSSREADNKRSLYLRKLLGKTWPKDISTP